TELDRSVIEVIGDPLIHLLRNSIDHGLETPEERVRAGKPRKGSVWLRARHEENFIVIEIEDDGRGIDPNKLRAKAVENGMMTPDTAVRLSDRDALNLIFVSGFSTAEAVSEVSGRGVGMDIVKSNLTQFGALIDVESHVGKGTRFRIKLPLTLAIIRGLLVKVDTGVYVLPIVSVVETLKVSEQEIHLINGREVILQRSTTLPLVRLQLLFHGIRQECAMGYSEDKAAGRTHYIVVVGAGERRVGLIVDALLGDQEIVIKSLGKFVGDMRGLSGATILGDGRIALIVDVNGLLSIAMEKRGAYAV
ncbi:MAG TPA: chemotaxis protein CheA, partial [Chthonomonadales bacterium]|nr:chemotaxis protein CheA [Chthonomonadales bacterium]